MPHAEAHMAHEMVLDKDVAVPMRDGALLRANVFRPKESGKYPVRPHHTHDEVQKLAPGEVYPVDIEIWPTSLKLPKGYRLALTLQGQDFDRPGEPRDQGAGWFTHDDPRDRPPAIFSGTHTIHTGGSAENFLLLPVVPA
jgi:uncharacterized protein